MRTAGETGIPRQGNGLAGLHDLAGRYLDPVLFQMAIVSQRSVCVADDDEIVVRIEPDRPPADIGIVFDPHHASAAGGPNFRAFGHLPVNRELVRAVMTETAVVTLGHLVAAA